MRRAIRPPRIAILDDLFPHPISGFRFEEFSSYLEQMRGVSVHCNGGALRGGLREKRSIQDLIAEYVAARRRFSRRVHPLLPGPLPEADAYYAIFLHNIAHYVEAIEHTKRPFAFTLYPGGSFRMRDKCSDDKLRRVCGSPLLRKVIVTQPCTLSYLAEGRFLSPAKILYLQGGVVPRAAFVASGRRAHFGLSKQTLDIGFVANRNMPMGEDKGYDLFVETARALTRQGLNAIYHVVGPWDATIVPLGDSFGQFIFYGFLSTEKLRELGGRLDLILSPNRPDVVGEGAFDGFPTGSCVEVGLQGAAIFCTDVLKLNTAFRDGVDIVLIEPDVDDILRRLMPIIQQPRLLAQIGKNGQRRLKKIFGREVQLPPRLAVLRALCKG
ncbi:MAG: glycosyltransferase [Chthoniobacterales bacterium]